MSWSTIFVNGALAVTVRYNTTTLYDGSIGLSSSVDFPDFDASQATLAVNGTGDVTLTNSGGFNTAEYSIDFDVPAGSIACQIIGCSTSAASPLYYARPDLLDTDMTPPDYLFSTVPAATMGFAAKPGGS